MADGTPDGTDEGPSLEMPSFSLRRKRKAPQEPAPRDEATAPEPAPVVEQPEEPAAPVPAAKPEPVPAPVRRTAPTPPAEAPTAEAPTAVQPAVEPETEPDAPAAPAHVEPRPRRQLPTITLAGIPAAAVTGVVVGALALLLSWLATSACDVVRGTSSCGGGPGLLILVAVLALLAYVGGVLLRIFTVPDAWSTSILAVGILAVLVLVFLLGSIDAWWMVIAIPVAAVVAYCASWWVTTSVVGADSSDASPQPDPYDVR